MHALLHPFPSSVLPSSQGSTAAVIESPQTGEQLADPGLLNVPVAHPVHKLVPAPEYVSIGQAVQAVAPESEKNPAAQLIQEADPELD